MPVSKKRSKHTSAGRRRARERQETQLRKQHHQVRVRHATHRILTAAGSDEVIEALQYVGRLTNDGLLAHTTRQILEPRVLLGCRRGWKHLGEFEDYPYGERWIYTPSIPEVWDESTSHSPTEVSWDGEEFTVTPAVGPTHDPREATCYSNAMRFFIDLPLIEAW